MFYLKEFFKSLGESVLRGMSFFLLSCLLAFALTHRSWISNTIARIGPEKLVNPYFVAVVDGSVDSSKITSAIRKLPGVLAIQEKNQEGKSKLLGLVKQLGSDYTLDSQYLDFKSLRIELNSTLSTESLDFVRGQAVKLGGREHVTATEVKYPEVAGVMKSHPFYRFLASAGDWGVIGVIALLWVVSFWLTYDVFRSRSYIIEKFQRKKLVAAKSLATGLGLVFFGFTALGVLNGTLKFFDLVILFMVFSVFWTFSMQEWKWKPTL